jgi:hypothetical protein
LKLRQCFDFGGSSKLQFQQEARSRLAFLRRLEKNGDVHLAWPFKSRNGDDRNGENGCAFAADPRPDFLCVGAQKAGTSWLYQQLAEHPDFWMPPLKGIALFQSTEQDSSGSFCTRTR